MTKYKTLLGLNIYRLSSNYIESVRQLNPQREKFARNIPTYCVADHKITLSEYHFQFTSEGRENWVLFDIDYCHPLIQNEISEIGEENFIDNIDLFQFIRDSIHDLLIFSEEYYKKSIPRPTYLIIEITYMNSYDPHNGEYDCEVEYKILNRLEL